MLNMGYFGAVSANDTLMPMMRKQPLEDFFEGTLISKPFAEAAFFALHNLQYTTKLKETYLGSEERIEQLKRDLKNSERRVNKAESEKTQVLSRMESQDRIIRDLQSALSHKEDTSIITMLQDEAKKLREDLSETQVLLKASERSNTEKDDEIALLLDYKEYAETIEALMNKDTESSDFVSDITFIDIFAGKRVFVFGGYVEWRENLVQTFKEQGVVHTLISEEENRTLPNIGKNDFVLMNVTKMSHSYYYKIMSKVKRATDYVYRTSSTGVNQLLHELLRTSFATEAQLLED
jgi:hypothetical protein